MKEANENRVEPDSNEGWSTGQIVEPEAERGIVVRAHGLFFEVSLVDSEGSYLATLRGALKRSKGKTDVVAVGDRVWVVDSSEGEARILHVEPRVRTLGRLARHTRDVEQVILANPDQVCFVFAAHHPEPHLGMLDRFLALAERSEVPARILVNKLDLDLDSHHRAREKFSIYEPVYPVHYISAKTGLGFQELDEALVGRVTAIAGPSGVGKSSILNRLDPGYARATQTVSDATGKGRHTTIGTELRRIGESTFVADTPGIRALAMDAVGSEELPELFPEIRAIEGPCRFNNCTHLDEPGCAIKAAVEDGRIAVERYASYSSLRRAARAG